MLWNNERDIFYEEEETVKVFAMVVNSPRITLEDVDHKGQTIFHVAFECIRMESSYNN